MSRRLIPFALVGVLTVAAAVAAWASPRGGAPASTKGPEGVPVYAVPDLAPRTTTASGAPVDGITCRKISAEVVKYHVHIYLSFYVDGQRERVPAGVGITTPYLTEHTSNGPFLDVGVYDCLYWLHTHAADGIIHIESPVQRTYTLGEFFDEWGQALGPAQVGPATGRVVALYDGKVYQGNPRDIPLTAHAQIQLDIGTPLIAPQPVSFPTGL